VKLEVDHVIARSAGGPDTMENLVTACWDCNRGKSAKEVLVAVA
jgi:5-methylcytosine-specific restriction endonuclease McrA